MRVLTFKVTDNEARRIRQLAHAERVSVSEYLRRRALDRAGSVGFERVKCEFTGAEILRPTGALPPLTTEEVKKMLSDFPRITCSTSMC